MKNLKNITIISRIINAGWKSIFFLFQNEKFIIETEVHSKRFRANENGDKAFQLNISDEIYQSFSENAFCWNGNILLNENLKL